MVELRRRCWKALRTPMATSAPGSKWFLSSGFPRRSSVSSRRPLRRPSSGSFTTSTPFSPMTKSELPTWSAFPSLSVRVPDLARMSRCVSTTHHTRSVWQMRRQTKQIAMANIVLRSVVLRLLDSFNSRAMALTSFVLNMPSSLVSYLRKSSCTSGSESTIVHPVLLIWPFSSFFSGSAVSGDTDPLVCSARLDDACTTCADIANPL
mmetsp:Transcript_61968/g.128179  ORF Transcript_61968/g.128179 Transcript_61968/m.128179 type:complete len:207 (+) Transcript_61968:3186-3806(+)